MYVNLSEKFITTNSLPHLSQYSLGRRLKIPLLRIVKGIIITLKNGQKMTLEKYDGSHTPTKRGGQAGRNTRPLIALFLTDKKGIPIAISPPIRGNHNDLFVSPTISLLMLISTS